MLRRHNVYETEINYCSRNLPAPLFWLLGILNVEGGEYVMLIIGIYWAVDSI